MGATQNLGLVLEDGRSKKLAACLAVIFLLAYLTVNNVIVPWRLAINPLADGFSVGLVVALSALSALFFTVWEYNRRNFRLADVQKKGVIGAILGFATTACAICQPLWLFYLGAGALAPPLIFSSPLILGISALLVGYSLYTSLKTTGRCAIAQRKEAEKK